MKTFNKVRSPIDETIDEKGKYTNIWNKVRKRFVYVKKAQP